MKSTIEEINEIHKSLGDILDKMNDLYRSIGTGGINGRNTRDPIYRERIDLLTEDYNKIKERLKEMVDEWCFPKKIE
jgi:tetrahydromethanopterin S-methyltransferase subunit G